MVAAAAAGQTGRAVDLLREHLASVGCDPLAFRIVARFRHSVNGDDFETLAGQVPGCHATRWPGLPDLRVSGTVERVRQHVRFCAASDGVRLAYALHGSGPPLVWVANGYHGATIAQRPLAVPPETYAAIAPAYAGMMTA